jgi:hypothetical protein
MSQCSAIFSVENLVTKGIGGFGKIRFDLATKLQRGFTREIACVENTFKIDAGCVGDSGSPVVR